MEYATCQKAGGDRRGAIICEAWRKADILEWDAIGRPSAEEYRDLKEMAQKKAIAFFDPLPFKPVDKMVDKYR